MLFSQPASIFPALVPLLQNWRISFQSIHFLLFLPVVVGAYFVLPQRFRRVLLLLASYYFYFFTAAEYLVILLGGTLFSYIFAQIIATRKTDASRRAALFVGVIGLVLGLAFFKYNGFFASFLAPLLARAGIPYNSALFSTAKAFGISFYTFTAIGYLIDTARKDIPAEKNFLTHALFLGFFPSITSGPISRAGTLLPQLKNLTPNAAHIPNALRLIAIGFFKKLAVADTLAIFVNAVFGNIQAYHGLSITLAAAAFALQLYFDFSGYTDIARGTAALFGIHLPQNFKNPYFSTNFSAFWARWHMSLSTWLQDYIFTPLVWSRWPEKLPIIGKRAQKPPVLSSIAIVFLISGVWHGDTLCFLVWGALQAVFRIGEELLHRILGKPNKNPSLLTRIGKTAVVLVLWAQSLVFFRMGNQVDGTVGKALSALARQFSSFSPIRALSDVWDAVLSQWYNDPRIAALFVIFTLACLAAAIWADWYQCFHLKGGSLARHTATLRPAARWCIYYALVLCCFAAFIAQSGGYGGASFIYGGY